MESKLNVFLDKNFVFDESAHSYNYLDSSGKSIQKFTSVTQFINTFKPKFDSTFWAKKKAKARGVSPEVILNEWKQISDTALDLGSALHKWIEDYYNGINPAMPTDDILRGRVEAFLELHSSKLYKFRPVHQEFRLFSRKWNIAGTTDAILHLDPNYYVGDWKTNKKFTTDQDNSGRYQKLLYPFNDYWNNSLNVYSIQLSLYRLIMEEEAGFTTNGAFLVWIGPHEKPQLHKTVDFRDRLYEYLKKNNQ